ncbi:DNA repair protein RAD51 homolog 3-like [Sitodiplosis mosellana]|uniref:DNA repair protein RAD51 homolog 3-like n=1 Tax=Sitodiplosis mosellana TaxID=263140 RepID=UPI002444A513|nr:DNA repair protein RAD51 homolog 3-like [Sitodiplosis mosellana]
MFSKSAYEVWKEEKEAGVIITLCREMDDAIGGGIRIRLITEFVGGPGTGKTQFCLQLCVNVQIPKCLQGLEAAAVYIDTNRGFSINRIKEIASATQAHCDRVYRMEKSAAEPNSFTVDSILANIHCTFCNNYIQLLATIYRLDAFLANNPKVQLIVIDSFSYLFRSIDENVNLVQTTYEALSELQKLADKYRCAVVITNELTTRVIPDGPSCIVPALGESHSHRVNVQLTFGRDEDDRRLFVANIDKCFTKCEQKVAFQITKDGLRPYKLKSKLPD